jgi:hypothetical protein
MLHPHRGGARAPGPLGFRQVLVAAPGAVGKLARTLKMPAPAADAATKEARAFTWNLFNAKGPGAFDMQQGDLTNCPIPAILSALAHTEKGAKHIQGMLVEHGGASVVTDLSAVAGELATVPKDGKILTSRFFSVKLGGKAFEVSDVLYTDEAVDPTPIYMRSPKKALWACVIEKAYAVRQGDYYKLNELDADGQPLISANQFWKVLVGSDPKVMAIDATTDFSDIRRAAAAAGKLPTVGATKPYAQQGARKVSGWHGFAMLGIQGSKLELYDPALAKSVEISLSDFRKDFLAILSGNP